CGARQVAVWTAGRSNGPAAGRMPRDSHGRRLARIEPVTDGSALPPRLATIAVERTLATIADTPAVADTFAIATPLAPVTLRLRWGVEAPRPPSAADTHAFLIPGRGGGALVDAEVSI